MIQKLLTLFRKPKPKPVTLHLPAMYSEQANEWAVLQDASLVHARNFHSVYGKWRMGKATKQEMEAARDAYVASRRALPLLSNGKHLGCTEAHKIVNGGK